MTTISNTATDISPDVLAVTKSSTRSPPTLSWTRPTRPKTSLPCRLRSRRVPNALAEASAERKEKAAGYAALTSGAEQDAKRNADEAIDYAPRAASNEAICLNYTRQSAAYAWYARLNYEIALRAASASRAAAIGWQPPTAQPPF